MKQLIVELIGRRRHQILVHSAIYYEFNDNIIDDVTFDNWSKELVELSEQYPQEAQQAPLSKEFEGFDGSTGAFLPYKDERTISRATQLVRYEYLTNRGQLNDAN